MSKTSLKERNKAVRLAWEREQELVSQGKGTRDWSQDQQKDILDPNKGKAYDENGRAFEGQHMKSAAKYPEYQGDPNNIQFLSKEEHLEAHKGSWNNPTNWYYDPVAMEFFDFGDGPLVPCKVLTLSEPVFPSERITPETEEDGATETQNNDITKDNDTAGPSDNSSDGSSSTQASSSGKTTTRPKLISKIGKFSAKHPEFIKCLKLLVK